MKCVNIALGVLYLVLVADARRLQDAQAVAVSTPDYTYEYTSQDPGSFASASASNSQVSQGSSTSQEQLSQGKSTLPSQPTGNASTAASSDKCIVYENTNFNGDVVIHLNGRVRVVSITHTIDIDKKVNKISYLSLLYRYLEPCCLLRRMCSKQGLQCVGILSQAWWM